MKKLGQYLLANNTRAAILSFLCTLLPLIEIPGGIIAAIIVGLITLRKGYKSGLLILAFIALPAISLLVLREFQYGPFDATLMMGIFVWIFALVFRNTYSWARVLEIMAGLGAVIVLMIHLLVPTIRQFWLLSLDDFYKQSGWAKILGYNTPDRIHLFVVHVAPVATGGVMFLFLLGVFILLLLARWWQAIVFSADSLRKEFTRIQISRVVSIMGIFLTAALFFKWGYLLDLYPVLLLPFMIAGLSLLHKVIGRLKQAKILLFFVYAALVLVSFLMVILLAFIGFVDSWYNFRKRFCDLPGVSG